MGATKSAAPLAMAFCGMELNSASAGSCTITTPPASLTARTPRAPSAPAPDRTTAIPSPRAAAIERKNRSTGARRPRGSLQGPPGHRRCKLACVDDEFTVGRDHEDAVALQRGPVLDQVDWHLGAGRQDLGECARLIRGEVQDDHVSEAEVRREMPEQRLQRRDSTRRGADGADRDETGGQGDLRLLLVCVVHAVRSSAQKRRRSTGPPSSR